MKNILCNFTTITVVPGDFNTKLDSDSMVLLAHVVQQSTNSTNDNGKRMLVPENTNNLSIRNTFFEADPHSNVDIPRWHD